MNKRYDIPETSVTIRLIAKNGSEGDAQDCVAGIDFSENGTLSIDLRSLRPVRVLDRDNLVIELYTHDVLTALADKLESSVEE